MLLLNIMLYVWIFGTLFMPYIIGIVASIIIIYLIRKRLMGKNKIFKFFIYTIIVILCVFIFRYLGYSVMLYLSEKPDKVYTEMQEINDSKELIGLSKEEVIALLGEPMESSTDSMYVYDAGTLTNYLFLGEREFYDFFIFFDKNDKVKSTKIDLPRGG